MILRRAKLPFASFRSLCWRWGQCHLLDTVPWTPWMACIQHRDLTGTFGMTSQNIKVLLPPEKKTVVWQFGYCILKHIETFFYMWYLYIILPLFDVSSFLASFSRSSFVAGLPWWRQCCRMKTSRMGWWRRRLGDSCLLWQVVAEWDKTSVNCRTLPGSGAMARPVTSKAHWPGIVWTLNASKIFRVYVCWITSFWVATSDLSDWSGWSGWRQINSPTWWGKLGPQKSEISSELRQALAAFVATTQLLCFAFHQNTIVQYQYQIVSPPIYKEKKILALGGSLVLQHFRVSQWVVLCSRPFV